MFYSFLLKPPETFIFFVFYSKQRIYTKVPATFV